MVSNIDVDDSQISLGLALSATRAAPTKVSISVVASHSFQIYIGLEYLAEAQPNTGVVWLRIIMRLVLRYSSV